MFYKHLLLHAVIFQQTKGKPNNICRIKPYVWMFGLKETTEMWLCDLKIMTADTHIKHTSPWLHSLWSTRLLKRDALMSVLVFNSKWYTISLSIFFIVPKVDSVLCRYFYWILKEVSCIIKSPAAGCGLKDGYVSIEISIYCRIHEFSIYLS